MAENAAEDFGDDEAESCGHGPTEDGGLEWRMGVTGMTVAVGMAVGVGVLMWVRMFREADGATVVVGMGVVGHLDHCTHLGGGREAGRVLIGQYGNSPKRID